MAADGNPCHDQFLQALAAMSTKGITVIARILDTPVPIFLTMELIFFGLAIPRKMPRHLLTSIGYRIPC